MSIGFCHIGFDMIDIHSRWLGIAILRMGEPYWSMRRTRITSGFAFDFRLGRVYAKIDVKLPFLR